MNTDHLYDLMPAVYRLRDAERGYPLQALLRVIAEQADVIEDDIRQLYDNWFIETAQEWVVPYIGDLVGYRPVHEAGEPGDPANAEGAARNRILIPRREIANTIGFRRRKGTLALLEQLANDVAGWPAHAVEFYRLLGWTQNMRHARLNRGRTVDVRDGDALDLLTRPSGSPFDAMAHTVDVRRISSALTFGQHNIPSVGVFVWRLKTYSVTRTPAHCYEEQGPQSFTFSVLGQDTPLYTKPRPKASAQSDAELHLPGPIRRRAFEKHLADDYGPDKSLAVWAEWGDHDLSHVIPASAVIAADLSDWKAYQPPLNKIAIDPERGRLVFPPSQLPKRVRVSYRYGFSDDVGGGEYNRTLFDPSQPFKLYRVGEDHALKRINDALAKWRGDQQRARDWPEDTDAHKEKKVRRLAQLRHAVIEIGDSNVYVEPLGITLYPDESLQIRAANRTRPVIRLLDWQTDLPDSLVVALSPGSRITLDGLLITGRAVQIRARERDEQGRRCEREMNSCGSQLVIRHCTLVPGWGIRNDCEPRRPAEPSLELYNVRANVRIEHSIIGSIQVHEDEVRADPIPISMSDSIVDSAGDQRDAISPLNGRVAHCVLTVRRCTVFGIVNVHAIELAENSIFVDCLNVARRQIGCMRFCYVPPGCRTPRRYHCQPDLAEQAATSEAQLTMPPATPEQVAHAQALARERVRPQFTSIRYGQPYYAHLAHTCPVEIRRGADDESEMGVFHDLFAPQREANLRARLDEYMPADMQAGIIFAT